MNMGDCLERVCMACCKETEFILSMGRGWLKKLSLEGLGDKVW